LLSVLKFSCVERYPKAGAQASRKWERSGAAARCLLEASIQSEERPMSSTTDKIKGTANEAIGKVKQKIGEATGDRKMQGEGALQEAKGKSQKVLGDAKDIARDAVDKATGAASHKH